MTILKTTLTALALTTALIGCGAESRLDDGFTQRADFTRSADGNTLQARADSLILVSEEEPGRSLTLDVTVEVTQLREGSGAPSDRLRGGLIIGDRRYPTPNHRQWRSGYATLESIERGAPIAQGDIACEAPRFEIAPRLTVERDSIERAAAISGLSPVDILGDPASERALFRDPAGRPDARGTSTIADAGAARITTYLYCGPESFVADVAGLIR